ncbi:hypothetical protein [Phenylobacterium sp.]|nr:hypothetical protein [Phenylobacterium sp.]MDP1617770.1 hypothetical protein [Phenylobacterium sp.]MDP1988951.1 hypothetical protein [Phenylobacterium sp.]
MRMFKPGVALVLAAFLAAGCNQTPADPAPPPQTPVATDAS